MGTLARNSGIAQEARGAKLHLRLGVSATVAALAVLGAASHVGAATLPGKSAKLHPSAVEYTNDCPADDGGDTQETLAIKASCRVQAERLEELHADLLALDTELETQGAAIVSAVEGIEPGGDGGLTQAEHDALNIQWYGTWALVGLAFVGLLAAAWYRAWGLEGKLGRG